MSARRNAVEITDTCAQCNKINTWAVPQTETASIVEIFVCRFCRAPNHHVVKRTQEHAHG